MTIYGYCECSKHCDSCFVNRYYPSRMWLVLSVQRQADTSDSMGFCCYLFSFANLALYSDFKRSICIPWWPLLFPVFFVVVFRRWHDKDLNVDHCLQCLCFDCNCKKWWRIEPSFCANDGIMFAVECVVCIARVLGHCTKVLLSCSVRVCEDVTDVTGYGLWLLVFSCWPPFKL